MIDEACAKVAIEASNPIRRAFGIVDQAAAQVSNECKGDTPS